MQPTFNVKGDIAEKIAAYRDASGKTFKETLRYAGKRLVRILYDITPPASAGRIKSEAFKAGKFKIQNQMLSVLVPKKLKGRREIKKVFGRTPKKRLFVATRELYPDVRAVYRNQTRTGKSVGIRTGRVRQKFTVDKAKFTVELNRRQARVGILASGWNAAAAALGHQPMQWQTRHGSSRGRVKLDLDYGSRMSITMANTVPSELDPELWEKFQRQVRYAPQYLANDLKRQTYHILQRKAQKSGIKVRDVIPPVPDWPAA